MAFVLQDFVNNPSVAQLELCRKDYLFLIANHYGVRVSKSLLKRELKALVLAGLAEQAVLDLPVQHSLEAEPFPEVRSPFSVDGAAAALVGDNVEQGELKPPLTLPCYESPPVDCRLSGSSAGDRVKIRLARLNIETRERAEERQARFNFDLEVKRIEIEAETAIRIR